MKTCHVQFTPGMKVHKIDLLNDLDFSLCAVPPVCHVVATSDNKKKSEMGVSADFGVSPLNISD